MAFCTNCGYSLEPGMTSCPKCHTATEAGIAPSGAPLNHRPRVNKKTVAIVAAIVAIATAMTAAAVVIAMFVGNHDGGTTPGHTNTGTIHKTTKEASDTLFKTAVDLGELVSDSSNAVAQLDSAHEFELRGEKAITENSHMADLVKYADYDMPNRDQAKHLEEELDTTPIWHLEFSSKKDNIGLDAVRKGAVPSSARFEGEHYGRELSCEDAEEIVSELYGYNGIALYKTATSDSSYRILGAAINDGTVADIKYYAYQSEGLSRVSTYITTYPIDEDSMKYVRQFAHLSADGFQDYKYEDSFIANADSSSLKELIDKNYDTEAFEKEQREKSDSIGSTFSIPFDLSDLIVASTDAAAIKLDNLVEFKSSYYSEGAPKSNYRFSRNVDTAAAMGLDVNGDDKADKLQGAIDDAPWYLDISDDDYNSLSRDYVKNGRAIAEVNFHGNAAVENPSCADVAKLMSPVYSFSRIVLHADSYTGDIQGFAVKDNTVATIYGTNLNDWNKGVYQLSISVFNAQDDGIGEIYKRDFDEEYRNDALRYSYDEVYFE